MLLLKWLKSSSEPRVSLGANHFWYCCFFWMAASLVMRVSGYTDYTDSTARTPTLWETWATTCPPRSRRTSRRRPLRAGMSPGLFPFGLCAPSVLPVPLAPSVQSVPVLPLVQLGLMGLKAPWVLYGSCVFRGGLRSLQARRARGAGEEGRSSTRGSRTCTPLRPQGARRFRRSRARSSTDTRRSTRTARPRKLGARSPPFFFFFPFFGPG